MRELELAADSSAHCLDRRDVQTRLLDPTDVDRVLVFRDAIIAGLRHPDLYRRETDERDFVAAHCGVAGETVGVFARSSEGERLVAYAMLGLPDADAADNMAHLIKASAPDRARTAHLAGCMVLPEWRGNGLQKALLLARMALARTRQRSLLFAMVSPHNHVSRRNLMGEGLHLVWAGPLPAVFSGVSPPQVLHRQIFAVDTERHWRYLSDGAQLVAHADLLRQQVLIEAGMHGVSEALLGPVSENQPEGLLVFAQVQPHHAETACTAPQ